MTETVETLMFEHLKRFQARLDSVQRDVCEVKTRQSDTHAVVLALRRDQANDAEIVAHLQVQLDTVRDPLDRVERRLDLTN